MDSNPRPTPPEKSLSMDCSDGGCDVRVFDAYTDARAEYEKKLTDWLRRHPDAQPE